MFSAVFNHVLKNLSDRVFSENNIIFYVYKIELLTFV